MIYPPQPAAPLVLDWIERHRDPKSFVLHLIGIPGSILGVLLMPIYLLLMSFTLFLFALLLFVGGFLLQFLGHALERTEPGEIKALRLWWAQRKKISTGRAAILAVPSEVEAT